MMVPIVLVVVASAASTGHLPCSPERLLPNLTTVRACSYAIEPWATFPEGTAHLEYVPSGNWTGIDKFVMDAVARIAGFNYTIQLFRTPGTNESWTDIAVAAALECDIALGDWKHTTHRLELGLLFTEEVGTDNTVIIASSNRHRTGGSSDEVRVQASNPWLCCC
jgi:hypothetical protein